MICKPCKRPCVYFKLVSSLKIDLTDTDLCAINVIISRAKLDCDHTLLDALTSGYTILVQHPRLTKAV